MTVTTLESLLALSVAVTSPDGEDPVSIEFPKVNGVLSPEDALLLDCVLRRYRSVNPDQALVTFETEDHWCLKVPRIRRVFSREADAISKSVEATTGNGVCSTTVNRDLE